MKKMRAFLSWLADILDDVLAYVLTIAGILFSNYIPMLKGAGPIKIEIEIGRIIVSAVVALLLVGKQESLPNKDPESRAGRRRNFGQRMMNALAQGVAWAQLMQLAG